MKLTHSYGASDPTTESSSTMYPAGTGSTGLPTVTATRQRSAVITAWSIRGESIFFTTSTFSIIDKILNLRPHHIYTQLDVSDGQTKPSLLIVPEWRCRHNEHRVFSHIHYVFCVSSILQYALYSGVRCTDISIRLFFFSPNYSVVKDSSSQ